MSQCQRTIRLLNLRAPEDIWWAIRGLLARQEQARTQCQSALPDDLFSRDHFFLDDDDASIFLFWELIIALWNIIRNMFIQNKYTKNKKTWLLNSTFDSIQRFFFIAPGRMVRSISIRRCPPIAAFRWDYSRFACWFPRGNFFVEKRARIGFLSVHVTTECVTLSPFEVMSQRCMLKNLWYHLVDFLTKFLAGQKVNIEFQHGIDQC